MEAAPPRNHRSSRVLPEDAQYEILLRLPADDACRLRAVCRRWRSLLSSPHFIAAHAARHPNPPPLVVVGYEATELNGRVLCDIVDLSGRVVKRVHAAAGDDDDETTKWWVMCTQLDLLCVTKGSGMSCQFLNPATGAVRALPDGLAAEHAADVQDLSDCWASIVFGLIPSTGEYKIHRMIEDLSEGYYSTTKLYEVFTLNGSPDETRTHCWRGRQDPPYDVQLFFHDKGVYLLPVDFR